MSDNHLQQSLEPAELRHHLRAVREREGCPLGDEGQLLALSSPPLYTPFPNPFVEQFLAASPRPAALASHPYSRDPIAADISQGRTDPAYLAQNYHTKVPYRAIARYIEHFTDPGDLVLDGFCGSGMVGVAANQIGRRAILCDLSPAATFIAHSYCHPVDLDEASTAFADLLRELQRKCGWLYEVSSTLHSALSTRDLDYVLWSEVFLCPHCSTEFPFSQAGFDFQRRRPLQLLCCPSCNRELHPNELLRSLDGNGRTKEVPARVAYLGNRRPREEPPDPDFFELQREIERGKIPYWYPNNLMMNHARSEKGWGDMWRRGYHSGMERVADFYFKRALWVLATAVHLAEESAAGQPVKQLMLQVLVNSSTSFTRMRRAYQGVLPLVLYVPKLKREVNVLRSLESRFRALSGCLGRLRTSDDILITTQSSTSLPNVPEGSVDYIFTDPPFGDNIRYSEVNFLWESWLNSFTNQGAEAIISSAQAKGVKEYQELMRRCFSEMHRVLKPDRWITVAFHNSNSQVWNAIQQALQEAGFEVAEVRSLDKQQVSFKQASANTVRHDLVISARKTRCAGQSRRPLGTIDPRTAWEYARGRLAQLPIPDLDKGGSEIVSERGSLALFNGMVAAHLRRGDPVPVDASQFYAGLRRLFQERDGMYFLPEQSAEYDRLAAGSRAKI